MFNGILSYEEAHKVLTSYGMDSLDASVALETAHKESVFYSATVTIELAQDNIDNPEAFYFVAIAS